MDTLDDYAVEAESLVKAIKTTLDPSSELRFQKVPGPPVLSTRIGGLCRRGHCVLKVKEQFNFDPTTGRVDKDYRYTILWEGAERLRIETQKGQPEHAHFPPRYLTNNGRHFNIDRFPPELHDMTFLKVFPLFGEIATNGGQLPEPFRSAK